MKDQVVALAFIGLIVWGLCRKGKSKRAAFHGHGSTQRLAWSHEQRHVRVLKGLKIAIDGVRVWREGNGWAGVTTINKSAANMRRWNALSPAEQAAVYMAGAMGSEGNYGCADDLARVDERTSRGNARRIARRYL